MLKSLVKKSYKHEEEQYLQLIKDLFENSSIENGRNGDTFCAIGSAMYFSLENNKIPILTTKKVAMKLLIMKLIKSKVRFTNPLLGEINVQTLITRIP